MKKLLIIGIIILLASCKTFEFKIIQVKRSGYNCTYYFFPVNKNGIDYLCCDTTKRMIYTFDDKPGKYQRGEIIKLKGIRNVNKLSER